MCNMKLWLVMVVTGVCMVSNTNATRQVPCFFIFGDSLSDNGNNNKLQTLAQVNHHPYGVDFKEGAATGRFTNGLTTIDILGQLLGFEDFIPSFINAQATNNIVNGVNYASGSAGILKETGKHLGENYDFRSQFNNHRTIVDEMGKKLGNDRRAVQHLNKCLYYVGLGSNDYINNFFSPHYTAAKLFSSEQFADRLIDRYSRQVAKLHEVGARKIALSGVGRIGCTPYSMLTHNTGNSCAEFMNEAVQLFNVKLLTMVDRLNSNNTDSKYIYINSYGMGGGDPSSVGFKNWQSGCCQVDNIGQCVTWKTPCQNRTEYVFWDGHHPTELVNKITASRIYNAYDLSDCYPLDVSQLVQWGPHNPNTQKKT